MTGDKAAELADIIRACGVNNTISSRGSPRSCFVCVVGHNRDGKEKIFEFRSFKAWDKFWKKVLDERRALREFIEKNRHLIQSKPRTPLDIMIDKACGIEP